MHRTNNEKSTYSHTKLGDHAEAAIVVASNKQQIKSCNRIRQPLLVNGCAAKAPRKQGCTENTMGIANHRANRSTVCLIPDKKATNWLRQKNTTTVAMMDLGCAKAHASSTHKRKMHDRYTQIDRQPTRVRNANPAQVQPLATSCEAEQIHELYALVSRMPHLYSAGQHLARWQRLLRAEDNHQMICRGAKRTLLVGDIIQDPPIPLCRLGSTAALTRSALARTARPGAEFRVAARCRRT